MPRKRNGFVPLGDIAGGVELPGDRALTLAAAVDRLGPPPHGNP